jgi:23S rRNA (uracil1939-C5)-methyltransferase
VSGKVCTLKVVDLAFDGKAVAHLDGKVVFLDAGLPGETVVAEITRSKPRYSQARVKEIVVRASSRIEAPCRHFEECGGCTWQDLDYAEQLRFKKQQVVECIRRIGGLEAIEVDDVLPSEKIFHYRNKMEFSFHVLDDGTFHLGLHRRGRFDEIFDLTACHLQDDRLNEIVGEVRNFVREKSIPVYDVRHHTGFMRFLVLRQAHFTGQTMVNLVTNRGDFPEVEELTGRLVDRFPDITTIVHGQNDKKSNIAVSEVENVLYGPGYIEEELLGLRFKIRANSFFQTNSAQAARLYQTGFDLLSPKAEDRLLDLYCGTGTIGLLLASRVGEVTGVELVSDAVEMARENAAQNRIENVTFFQGHVKEFLKSLPGDQRRFDGVVIDPPRAGLHPKALKRLLELQAPRILYISCNPATFARDAQAIVAEGYNVSHVRPVDMFPHTRHIELVALFSC